MQLIVDPRELALLVPREDLVIVHIGEAQSYDAGHVPGALHVTPRELVSGRRPAVGQLPDLRDLEALFARLGYRHDASFVAYDDEGGGWAGRFLWTLDMIGHRRWAYLDGGLHAWAAEHLPLEQASNRTAGSPAGHAVHLELDGRAAIGGDEILARLDDPRLVFWDSRSREEFEGRKVVSARGGHIPGATHLDWLMLMDRARQYRLRTDLGALLERHGITPDKEVVPYCQTHHRSGLSYLAARCLGYPSVRAYPGSWSEWGNRDDTPIATGS